MTESQIYPLLATLCKGNVFPYVAPQKTLAPWIVFSLPTETGDDVLNGQSGYTSTSLQVDVYAKTIDEANEIHRQVALAINPLMPVSLMKTKSYESDTGLNRVTVEVQV
ncbi:tail completion protein gp17 [Rouxiella chamberiensis]|uniref:DUF3168 domain-containing protein n=1 Tax=Rouxiella chamberiensis TaxID=1513468 RepID=A0ABY7HQ58_9GAMM|nr:DUF3168 domain-containing protein [Rouxiella chamberiensis]WAT01520.1 DUF3168 domain-containing protein [Rouxiella chamberiensis]